MSVKGKVTLKDEISKNLELHIEDIHHLRNWLTKQPHLPSMTDERLALFLHSCYYSLELTKQTIDTYWTMRTYLPEFFADRNLKSRDFQTTLKTMSVAAFPGLTNEGYKVIIFKLVDFDTSKFIMNETIKLVMLITDLWQLEEGTWKGLIYLIDMEGMNFSHFTKLNPIGVKKIIMYLQEAMPVRLKGIHLFNVASFTDKLLGLIKSFAKKELTELLYTHPESLESVYKYIPQKLMPCNYPGGQSAELEDLAKKSLELIAEYQGQLLKEDKLKVDETKRPGKAKNEADFFGIEGSFKKLDID